MRKSRDISVFTAVKLQVEAFWIVKPCSFVSFVVGYRRFLGIFCLLLQGKVSGDERRSLSASCWLMDSTGVPTRMPEDLDLDTYINSYELNVSGSVST
jgi:hypothetical protein